MYQKVVQSSGMEHSILEVISNFSNLTPTLQENSIFLYS
jgi:hypothetical protein